MANISATAISQPLAGTKRRDEGAPVRPEDEAERAFVQKKQRRENAQEYGCNFVTAASLGAFRMI